MRRLVRELPKSPSKRVAAVCGLAECIGLQLVSKMDSSLSETRRTTGITEEVKKLVRDFYGRPDIVYTAPGMKDEMTVRTSGKKDRVRKL